MDTIYALASGRPPAAIAVVRISGPKAHEAGEQLGGTLPDPRVAAVRALRAPNACGLLDHALVLRFDGPASATGEDVVELHLHGGRAVTNAVLAALGSLDGLRLAEPGEFTRRAFANGRIDLTEAEGLADLIEAETESQRRSALLMADGAFRQQIEQWQERLLALSARAEAAIDYVDDESVDGDPALSGGCGVLAGEIGEWLERPRAEPLRNGVRVVISGPPNAGKSSLLNAIAGFERAIVTEIPGTTRDHIDVPLVLDGVPIRLTDTAGLRESDERVEQIGVDRARDLVERADILLWLGEAGEAPGHDRLIAVYARADLPERSCPPDGSLPVSSTTGAGLKPLVSRVAATARDLLPAEDEIALNNRQADCLSDACTALRSAAAAPEIAIAAESLRAARTAFDRLTGRAGVEDMLDALFGRFCLGK